MKKFFICIFILSILLLSYPSSFAQLRQEILINDQWQVITGKGLTQLPEDEPSENEWWDSPIPKDFYSNSTGEATYGWAKRQIDIPSSWQNYRIFVRFNSCRFNPHIYIDGNLIAQRMDGWTPFEVEITSFVKSGSTHWLQLRCQDRTATHADGFIREQGQPYDVIRGKVLAPIGGDGFYGPMDDVWLFSRPDIYLDDIAIVTSTKNETIAVSGILQNSTMNNLWVEGKIFDKDELSLEIPAFPVKDNKWKISSPFTNAEYWSPENPHLYKLQLILRKGKEGEVIDKMEERFGFKEFWTDGPDFYLNGVKRHLLGSGCWPIAEVESHEKIREKLEAVKAANIVAFRYHVQPWPKRWVEIADEVGIMIICEAAVYTDQVGMYAYNDERFWENYKEHLQGLVKRDRNNASVIMWSIENELLHMGMDKYSEDLHKKLGDMGRFVKELDPHHPIIFDGDIDPDGAADVIGLHYPHEPPTYSDWPNTADWLKKRTKLEGAGGMLGVTRRNFYWEKTKPLYIGEYLWMPDQDYASGTIFFGDEAYIDKHKYHNKAKLQAWIDQTIAYRRTGLSGMCPWSCFRHGVIIDELTRPFYEAQIEFYRPIVAFLRNKNTRFFSGDSIERTFDVLNDSPSKVGLSLKWELKDSQIKGEENFSLEPGGYKPVTISFTAPDVNQPRELHFQSELTANNKIMNTIKEKYTIEKRKPITAPAGTNILLYDPENILYAKIPSAKNINSFYKLRRANINNTLLIIAPKVTGETADSDMQIGNTLFNSSDFLRFLKRGGRAIVLEQNTLNGFGLGLLLAEKASTMTFALNKKHPVLAGLSEEDLEFWREDNYVTNYEIVRPTTHGARAITVSGNDRALNQSPVMEFSTEKGSVLFIQALVGQKLDVEPSARRILQNSIDYMAAKKTNATRTIVFNSDANFKKTLSETGLDYREVRGALNKRNLKNADILILCGGGEKITQSKNAIEEFLKSPFKTLYWHNPDMDTFEALKDTIKASGLKIVDSQGPVSVNLRGNELLSGVSREDLMFISEPSGWRREINIDTSVIDKTIMPRLRQGYGGQAQQMGGIQQKIEAENLELSGNRVSVDSTGENVHFKTLGTATGYITVPESGVYILSLTAGGKEAWGAYPFVIIEVDDEIIKQLILSQNEMREYTFLAELPAGRNKLEIIFINGSPWGGGRELVLDSLVIKEKAAIPDNIEFITLPAALVNIKTDNNQIIIDNIKWDSNERNLTKGLRYASALLANLGASFEIDKRGDITWLDIEKFELIGESPYFEKTVDQLRLRSDGTVSADFDCAQKSKYTVYVRGYSTPVKDEYALVEVLIDDKVVGEKIIASSMSDEFEIGAVTIPEGEHQISVSFVNDLWEDGQDRNLFIDGIGFREN